MHTLWIQVSLRVLWLFRLLLRSDVTIKLFVWRCFSQFDGHFFPQRTQIQLVGYLEAAKGIGHWLGVSQSWPQGEGNEGNSIWDADLKEHKAGKGWKRCIVFRNKIFSPRVQHGPGASWTVAGAARTNKSFFSRDSETFHRLCAHRTWLRQLWSW